MINHAKRFWLKVDRRGPEECWPWLGQLTTNGYGQFYIGSKRLSAHRVSYEFLIGLILDGLTLDHLCRNRACVNPAHLEPVTQRENVLRGVGLAAQNAKKTHCPKGHPYDPENTYIEKSGGKPRRRHCRTCELERQHRRYLKRKAEYLPEREAA